jgi:hypothetical protein
MREEGILLSGVVAPALFCWALLKRGGEWMRRAAAGAALAGGLLASLLGAFLLIAACNYAAYGVFIVNDISGGNFPKLAGQLKRIDEGPRPDLLLEPAETDKLLALSPDFRRIGNLLKEVQQSDPDVDYSHQMFFLKVGALRDAGNPPAGSAVDTQAYFKKLALEIDGLCREGKLNCRSEARASVIPRMSAEQRGRLSAMMRDMWRFLFTTSHSGFNFTSQKTPGIEPVPDVVYRRFVEVSRQEPFGWDGQKSEYTMPAPIEVLERQKARRERIGKFYTEASPWLYVAGGIAFAFLTLLAAARPGNLRIVWLVLAVLGVHVAIRVMAFSYLAAIDGSITVRLLSPAYPFGLAFCVLSLGLVLSESARQISACARVDRG